MNKSWDRDPRLDRLPPALIARLKALTVRVRRILWMRGLLTTAVVFVLSALSIMAIDALFLIYSNSVRWALSLGALGLTLTAAAWSLVRPLMRPITLTRMARIVEHRHPELEERISSAVELLGAEGDGVFRGSERLINLLGEEAEVQVGRVEPRHEFTTRTLKPWLRIGAAGLGLLFLAGIVWPRHTALLLVRAVAPFAELHNIHSMNFTVIPGDATMLRGEPLTLALAVMDDVATRADLRRLTPTGREVVERMPTVDPEPGEAHRYALRMPRVHEDFRYRVRYGTGLSRYYDITVVTPPAMDALSLTYHYPEYTGREPETQAPGVMEIAAVDGTRVEVRAELNRPLEATLQLGARHRLDSTGEGDRAQWSFELSALTPPRWSVALTDSHGFTNAPVWAPIRVLPDQAPVITLIQPSTSRLRVPPHARIPLDYSIQEDFGIVLAAIHVARDEGVYESVRALEGMQRLGPVQWGGTDRLDLSRLKLDGVSELRLMLVAEDNLPPERGGPQVGRSREVILVIDHEALSLAEQYLAEQTRLARELLEAAAERVESAAQQLEELKEELGTDEPLSPEDESALDELRHDVATAEELLKQLQEAIEDTPFEKLTPSIEEAIEEHLTPAREQAEELQLADSAEQSDLVEPMEETLDAAAEMLEQLSQELDRLAEQAEAALQLDQLADSQEDLAHAMTEAPEDSPLDMWQEWQQSIMEELEALTEMAPDEMMEALQEALEQTQDLAQDSRDLAQMQEELHEAVQQLDDPETRDEAGRMLDDLEERLLPHAEPPPPDRTLEMQAQELQEQISEQAQALEEQAENLQQQFDDLGMADALEEAADALEAGREEAEAAAEHMEAGEQTEAEDAQEQAAEHFEAAADALDEVAEGLGEQLEQLAEAMAGPLDELLPGEQIDEALGHMEEMLQAEAMEPATEAAMEAAQALRQMALEAAQEAGLPAMPMPGTEPGEEPGLPMPSGGAGMAEPRMRLGPADIDWARVRGDVQPGAIEEALEGVAPEYRDLVRRYFRELAREGVGETQP